MTAKEERFQTTTVCDPLALRIGNMVHKGTVVEGAKITSEQGWMIRGEFYGDLTITDGTLWIDDGAKVAGRIHVHGTVYVFGQFGEHEGDRDSRLTCDGTLHLAASSVVYGNVNYRQITTYSGARVCSRMESMPVVA